MSTYGNRRDGYAGQWRAGRWLAVMLVVLAGCATVDPVDPLAIVPNLPAGYGEGEVPEGERLSLLSWVESFGEPQLVGMVEEAFAGNFDLRAAAARFAAAEGELRVIGADRLPHLSGGFTGLRQKRNFVGFPFGGGGGGVASDTSSLYNFSLDLSWELDVWGRLSDRTAAARLDADAVAVDLAAARLSIAGQVLRGWFNVIEAEQQVHLAQANVGNFRSNERVIERRFENGTSPALDLRLTRTQRATAEAALALRQDNLQRARRTLEVVLGRYPAAALGVPDDLPAALPPVPMGLPSDLLSRRPDLVAAALRVEGAGFRVSEARKAFLPRFSLTASGGTSSDSLRNLVDARYAVWSLAGNLVQPLFEGGRLTGALEVQRALLEESVARYGEVALNAFAEVETALAAEVLLVERERALAEAAREASAAEKLAWERYQRGLVDILTALDSERQSFEINSTLLQVRNLRLRNRIDLYLALGGDFEDDRVEQQEENDAGL